MAVYTGVVARVTLFDGARIVGEDLRFIPFRSDSAALNGGSCRLRISGSRAGTVDPSIREQSLTEFEGHLVLVVAASHDSVWLYGCKDIQGRQP